MTRIDQFLAGMGIGADARVTPLTPDASDRRYYRVEATGADVDGAASIVLAVHPGAIVYDEMPFADAHALLSAMPVPVPAVLGHSDFRQRKGYALFKRPEQRTSLRPRTGDA